MSLGKFTVVSEDYVNVFISSNVKAFTSEKKFAKSVTIGDLKGKLELITGGSCLTMKVSVFDEKDNLVCELADDSALLGSYPVDSGMRIHVHDNSRNRDDFENTDRVVKFELSKEEYARRENTVLSYLKRNKLGKFNTEEMAKLDAEKAKQEAEKAAEMEQDKKMAEGIKLGDRCEVRVPGNMARRGTVRFVGNVHFKPGFWLGVEYDEPLGKNDGTVDGKTYFRCKDKYGSFVKMAHVVVGDFPEEEIDLENDEM